MVKFVVNSDGGARGNPGPAGIGAVIKQKTEKGGLKTIKEISEFIGDATNNQAEYQGILAALKFLRLKTENEKLKIEEIDCYLDSQLVVEQMNGRYKIKNEGLKPLFWEIRTLVMDLGGRVMFEYVPREKNKEADKLVNEAIDKFSSNTTNQH
jgi:ribonuclease HI